MTTLIIIATCIFSFLGFKRIEIMNKYQFNPYDVKNKKEFIRFISHGFLHADWMHLFFNMFVLYNFGQAVEQDFNYIFGDKGYLYFGLLYFGGIIFSVLPTYKKHQDDYYYNAVGASGAVSAVMFSFILFNPFQELCLYGILCFKGIWWALAYLTYSYYKGKRPDDNINHEAHFWGAIFGVIFTIISSPSVLKNLIDKISTSI